MLIGCVVLLCALVSSELICRALGLGQPVLYETTAYGYRVQANQNLRRFGNRILYNSFGLRSGPTTALPAEGVLRVLCVGDSITNGGAVTDQDDTYPYRLQRLLSVGGRQVEVLNASAPGWAIANEAGWLRENGTLHSHVVLLTIGTTDLSQSIASAEIVDHHPSFPGNAPSLAIEELLLRYALPRLLRQSFADPGAGDSVGVLPDPGEAVAQVLSIVDYARQRDVMPLVMYVERPGQAELSDSYVAAGKSLLFETLKEHRVPYLDTRDSIERAGGVSLFRDGLHPNAEGNRVLAQVAANLLAPVVGEISPTRK